MFFAIVAKEIIDKKLGQKITRGLVAQWLVRRTWDLKVESSSPGWGTHVVVLDKTLKSHSPCLHQVYKWEPANCLGDKDNLTKCCVVTCDGRG